MNKWLLYLMITSFILLPTDQYYVMYGVIDRIVGDIAVILIKEKRVELKINISDLQQEKTEGSFITLKMVGSELIGVNIWCEKTEIERHKSEMLLKKIQDTN